MGYPFSGLYDCNKKEQTTNMKQLGLMSKTWWEKEDRHKIHTILNSRQNLVIESRTVVSWVTGEQGGWWTAKDPGWCFGIMEIFFFFGNVLFLKKKKILVVIFFF